MEVVAVIPARGGSKTMPRKNVAPFLGKPLIYWSIVAALRSHQVTRVIVSTDDEEIAQVAAMHGAEVPFRRPMKLAEDLVVDFPVIQHALDVLRETEGYLPDDVVQLGPTSPLRPVGLIKHHGTLDRTWKGTDHAASLEPDGFVDLYEISIR